MKIITAVLIDAFDGKIINLHPSLLPKYKGLNTFQRAIEAGDSQHGSSVHLVTTGLDDGPIIAQAKVNIDANDNIESLMHKTKLKENDFYPNVIELFATQQLSIYRRQPYFQDTILENPISM